MQTQNPDLLLIRAARLIDLNSRLIAASTLFITTGHDDSFTRCHKLIRRVSRRIAQIQREFDLFGV